VKVLIIHFRSGPGVGNDREAAIDAGESAGTDGVSLEMAKRAKLLVEMGHEVAIASAYGWADITIPELEFERREVVGLMRGLFDPARKGDESADRIRAKSAKSAANLLDRLREEIGGYAPDLVFVHNIFSLPIHPAATIALADYIRESGIPCAAIHHDVRSEGAYKFTPTCYYARRVLVDYFPPEMPNLRHWSINNRDRRFFEERGIPTEVIHDTLDFADPFEKSERAALRRRLRQLWGVGEEEVVLLLSTRIVPNKQVELAGALCREVAARMSTYEGKRLYNGLRVSEKTKVVLVLAGRPERSFHQYRDAVFEQFRRMGITWKYVGDAVMPRRDEGSGKFALYPDCYAAADFALYPTRWEGFGNQLLEIAASLLPVAVFEYPVFKEDIAPLGFAVVSLGDTSLKPKGANGLRELPTKRLSDAAERIWELLTDERRHQEVVERNQALGSRHFGLQVLREHLEEVTEWAAHYDRGKSN